MTLVELSAFLKACAVVFKPLNIESDSVGGVDIIYNKLNEFLKTTNGLEL
nr:MAG TPA: hypothetical protein [Caudoviricetes sp.]